MHGLFDSRAMALLLLIAHWAGSVGAKTEVRFSPRGGCEAMVTRSIDGAKKSIDAAVYSLNNPRLAEALIRAHKRGVKVRLLLDRTQAAGRTNKLWVQSFISAGMDLRLHSRHRIEHNKFGVYDGTLVSTGSFNWTTPAEEKNSENCVSLDEPSAVSMFSQRFNETLWNENTQERSAAALVKLLGNRSIASPKQKAE